MMGACWSITRTMSISMGVQSGFPPLGLGWAHKKASTYGVVGPINLLSIRVHGYGHNTGPTGMSVCHVANLVFEIIYSFD